MLKIFMIIGLQKYMILHVTFVYNGEHDPEDVSIF
jgi:hypothetical protein